MSATQIVGVWLLVAAGVVFTATVLIVVCGLWITREGRVGGARRGGCRRTGCNTEGCRRGDGWPRRRGEGYVERFLAGAITLEEMRRLYHEGRDRE